MTRSTQSFILEGIYESLIADGLVSKDNIELLGDISQEDNVGRVAITINATDNETSVVGTGPSSYYSMFVGITVVVEREESILHDDLAVAIAERISRLRDAQYVTRLPETCKKIQNYIADVELRREYIDANDSKRVTIRLEFEIQYLRE